MFLENIDPLKSMFVFGEAVKILFMYLFSRMPGQKLWTRVAVLALLVLTVMAAVGGKAEKQGDYCNLSAHLCYNKAIWTEQLQIKKYTCRASTSWVINLPGHNLKKNPPRVLG